MASLSKSGRPSLRIGRDCPGLARLMDARGQLPTAAHRTSHLRSTGVRVAVGFGASTDHPRLWSF
jgi:hypothetical protein